MDPQRLHVEISPPSFKTPLEGESPPLAGGQRVGIYDIVLFILKDIILKV
jgi:hypothetical protein